MQLLFICESFPTSEKGELTGGVEARDFYLSQLLSENNEVTVVTNRRQGIADHQTMGNLHILRVGLSVTEHARENALVRIVFFVTAVAKSLSVPASLVQGSNVFSQAIAFIVGLIKGIPKVALIPDIYIGSWIKNTGLITGITGEVLERIVISLPWQKIIAWSESTKTKLVKTGVNANNITVIYGGIEFKKLSELPIKKTTSPTITTAARLVSYKRVIDLIEAIALLAPKIPQIHLTIIGDGPERPRLERATRNLQLASHITFLGRRNHLETIQVIKASTLFCLPSIVEGFGLVTLEAMAVGTPYVNSAIAPTIEVTQNGQGGLLFEAKNPQDLADKIQKLLEDKKLYQQKAKDGVQLAALYDWNICATKTSALFKDII